MRLLKKVFTPPFSSDLWNEAIRGQAVLAGLTVQEQERLWALAHTLLHKTSIQTVGELVLNETDYLRIALLVSLPILNLDLDWYRGLHEIIIYPEAFAPRHVWQDEFGITHQDRQLLAGEAWDQGLMLLSWHEVETSGPLDGHHVVIHECAHWLDMQNGTANGRPPLHRGVDSEDWLKHFSDAYTAFTTSPHRSCAALDTYAAKNPAEFFAVCCELFFERALVLKHCWPEIYRLLVAFFQQTPDNRAVSV